jgi:pimeloyl-ACP methyl ester carboxylesterase
MATFVLMHGAWHGGWCWRYVAPALRAAGHDVHTPTLTGLGERRHLASPDVGLRTHVQDVVALLEHEDLRQVLLVAHSFSGMILPDVALAVPDRLKRLVYLDAFVPAAGQSAADFGTPDARQSARDDLAAGRWSSGPPDPAYLGIDDPDLAAWVAPRLAPHMLRTSLDVSSGDAWTTTVPSTLVLCAAGPGPAALAATVERARSAGWPVLEIPADHEVMLTAPRLLIDLLLDIAAS